jgi:hypothetical protein
MGAARRRWSIARSGELGRSIPPRFGSAGSDLGQPRRRHSLGLGASERVAAEFHELLVYDTGSFFVDHRDTEKASGMFATMVLVLPSTCSG